MAIFIFNSPFVPFCFIAFTVEFNWSTRNFNLKLKCKIMPKTNDSVTSKPSINVCEWMMINFSLVRFCKLLCFFVVVYFFPLRVLCTQGATLSPPRPSYRHIAEHIYIRVVAVVALNPVEILPFKWKKIIRIIRSHTAWTL